MRLGSGWRLFTLYGFLLFTLTVICDAQNSENTSVIHVESTSVLVPIRINTRIDCWMNQVVMTRCLWGDYEIPSAELPKFAQDPYFFPQSSFRLFEDGREEKIDSVERIARRDNGFRQDNLGAHFEWSWVPGAIWSTSDLDPALFKYLGSMSYQEWSKMPLTKIWGKDVSAEEGAWFTRLQSYYLLAYRPPPSEEGSCHRIRVKIARPDTQLTFRDEYCRGDQNGTDPLLGTKESEKLEQLQQSHAKQTIHLTARANYFYAEPEKARILLSINFPLAELRPQSWSEGTLPVNLLIVVHDIQDSSLVARRSDSQLGDSAFGDYSKVYSLEGAGALFTPTRYEAQIELPPGKYQLDITVSRGARFGVTNVPLTIDDPDKKSLSISSVALSKRVRKAGPQPIASHYIPLVAQGYEFTPCADAVFGKGDSLMAYFEVYEPSAPQPTSDGLHLTYKMKITKEDTGSVVLDTEENADSSIQPGKSTIPIAVEPVLKNLDLLPGKYTFAIQATDSAGRTATRATEFSID